jgi:threonine/homoserine/homoserine lactone efflux protein
VPSVTTLLLFALVTLALSATPGPAVLYLIGRAVGEGCRAGFASMLGIEAGELAWIVCAAVGLSALLAHSALALSGLRYLGAAYLILIGIRSWKHPESITALPPTRSTHAVAQGFIIQILNPKVALFFLAYFPQFLRPGHAVAPQVLLLGTIYIAVAFTSDSLYLLLATWLAGRFAQSARARRRQTRISALTYIALGLAAAALGDRHASGRALGQPSLAGNRLAP